MIMQNWKKIWDDQVDVDLVAGAAHHQRGRREDGDGKDDDEANGGPSGGGVKQNRALPPWAKNRRQTARAGLKPKWIRKTNRTFHGRHLTTVTAPYKKTLS